MFWVSREVNTEFVPIRTEDNKKVDIALFIRPKVPAIFIEVKADGKIMTNLSATEIQLRDYNRNMTVPFAIITDGRNWRFYHASAPGEFSQKCFAKFSLVEDELEDIEQYFTTFLKKSEINSERAEIEAKRYLHLNEKQRTMGDCLPEARRLTSEHPFPRLPEALLGLLNEKGYEATLTEVEDFIRNNQGSKPSSQSSPLPAREDKPAPKSVPPVTKGNARKLNPDNPGSLLHTRIEEGRFDGNPVGRYWKDLIHTAIRVAVEKGLSYADLRHFGNLSEGKAKDKTFAPIDGTNLFLQGMDANQCWKRAHALAKKLRVEISVRVSWADKEGALYPGEEGVLEWGPGN